MPKIRILGHPKAHFVYTNPKGAIRMLKTGAAVFVDKRTIRLTPAERNKRLQGLKEKLDEGTVRERQDQNYDAIDRMMTAEDLRHLPMVRVTLAFTTGRKRSKK